MDRKKAMLGGIVGTKLNWKERSEERIRGHISETNGGGAENIYICEEGSSRVQVISKADYDTLWREVLDLREKVPTCQHKKKGIGGQDQ